MSWSLRRGAAFLPKLAKGYVVPGLSLRVVTREGKPWFVAKDVCDVLEVSVTDTRNNLDEGNREVLKGGQYLG